MCEIQIIIPSGLWSVHGTLAIDNHHACVSILCFQQSLMQYTLCLNIPMKMRRKVGHGFCPRMNFTFIWKQTLDKISCIAPGPGLDLLPDPMCLYFNRDTVNSFQDLGITANLDPDSKSPQNMQAFPFSSTQVPSKFPEVP